MKRSSIYCVLSTISVSKRKKPTYCLAK